jgi:HIV Tat-specific factor 1
MVDAHLPALLLNLRQALYVCMALTMTAASSTNDDEAMLEQTYVYQNTKTGALSNAPLMARQLILLLSPAAGVVLEHITPKTNLLKVAEEAYDTEWKPADSIPILKQACAQFYYQSATDGASLGPVSCRELSKLLEKGDIEPATQVWSQISVEEGWTAIQELPELQIALKAFDVPKIQHYKPSATETSVDDEQASNNVQDELEAFLQSTDRMGPQHSEDDGDEEEGYQSDNGTNYVKDPANGNWIHAALVPQRKEKPAEKQSKAPTPMLPANPNNKKRSKKAKFSNKHMRNWVYITGLPSDTSTEEIAHVFGKVGIIDLDPESQAPKIKIYRHRDGPLKGGIKGDASLCFARPESVDLAIQLFDDAPFRLEDPKANILQVQRAKFEQEGQEYDAKRVKISNAKRKVAKLAALQAVGWDESENGRLTGGRKGLCIVVLKHVFTLDELKDNEDAVLANLEKEIRTECEEWGHVEKVTVFSKNPQGIAILKFGQPTAASSTVTAFHGRIYKGRKIEAKFWDGVTDYTVVDEEKEKIEGEIRREEFGSWLEQQELPEELRLQVEH